MPEVERVADPPKHLERRGAHHHAVEPAVRPRGDQQRRAHGRQQRPRTGPGHALARPHERRADHAEPEPPGDRAHGPRRRTDQREHAADRGLPQARVQQVERLGRVIACARDREAERRQGHERRDPSETTTRRPQQQRGPHQVELLLHAQRPQVEERLLVGALIEVPGVRPRQEVRHERGARERVARDGGDVDRRQQRPRGDEHGRQHERERGQQAARATRVEVGEGERALVARVDHQRGDQEAGDHEEHVHAREPARRGVGERVEEHDRGHGHAAQPVHVTPDGVRDAHSGSARSAGSTKRCTPPTIGVSVAKPCTSPSSVT